MKVIKALLIFPVRVYQYAISPLLGKNCRHYPTCSNYMIEAIQVWGPIKGSWLGLKRIARCHPWGTHGYDPVPRQSRSQEVKKSRSQEVGSQEVGSQ